ncbi:MAG: GTPase HflX [Thermoproteota archaeon]|nr:GTPase HflX [Thermoproteota archaeon]MDQ4022579.1 GTPase HflX [Thermoproteota archaeon]
MLNSNKTALLITYPLEEVTKEAISLADAARYSVIKIVNQRNLTQSKYGIGRGKAEEVKELVEQLKPEVIIFDEVLKPSQQYNLAKVCKIDILDRERLILEIFELRASTAESRIQIKLAQLRYDMVRAREKVRLARAGEQPGFFGMGKYDADVYYLDIKKRSAILKKKLEREETRRELFRIQRSRAGLPTISIAGYTSAGKTTLFNTLTGESKMEGKEVFTTLSTFTRAINLKNDEKLLISDTVGFISKLPAYMIDAFKSTLQDITYSDLVLLVVDISQPIEEIKKKLDSSIHIMNELKVPMTKVLYVMNKVDMINLENAYDKCDKLGFFPFGQYVVLVSSKTYFNIDKLKDSIALRIFSKDAKKESTEIMSEIGDGNTSNNID